MPTKKRLCRKPAPAALQIMISSFLPRPPCSASKQIGVYVPAKYQLWNDIISYGVWLWLRMSSHEWGRLRSDDEKILSLQRRPASALEATGGKPVHKPRLSLMSRLMRHISLHQINRWAAMMWSLILSSSECSIIYTFFSKMSALNYWHAIPAMSRKIAAWSARLNQTRGVGFQVLVW